MIDDQPRATRSKRITSPLTKPGAMSITPTPTSRPMANQWVPDPSVEAAPWGCVMLEATFMGHKVPYAASGSNNDTRPESGTALRAVRAQVALGRPWGYAAIG